MLGDNIYETGVESTTDPAWQTKFEQPYNDVDLPFYVALGNHDYGGNMIIDVPGIGNEFEKGQVEVDYTQVSTKWNMPATHYTFTWGDVGFIMLDTNSIVWSDTTYGDQARVAAERDRGGRRQGLDLRRRPSPVSFERHARQRRRLRRAGDRRHPDAEPAADPERQRLEVVLRRSRVRHRPGLLLAATTTAANGSTSHRACAARR